MSPSDFTSILLACLLLPLSTRALKHSFYTVNDNRNVIGPVGMPFGFLASGHYELSVFDFELKRDGKLVEDSLVEGGFILQRFQNEADFQLYMDLMQSNTSLCSFEPFRQDYSVDTDDLLAREDDEFSPYHHEIESAQKGIYLSMKSHKKWKPNNATIEYTFKAGEEGLYFLMYQTCPYDHSIKATFELDFHFMNYDAFGNPSFLTAGEMRLPLIFFCFAISYFICFVTWYTNIQLVNQGKAGHFETQPGARVYRIHYLMAALLFFKFLTLLFESIRYHAIRVSGHAQVWSFLYYTFTIIRGTFLFTVILLIGTGWSVVKPFLSPQEKTVVFAILFLQVINNIAIIFISQETEGENSYARWSATLHLVDIVCCCAVLIPLVWQVNALEKSVGDDAGTSGESAENGTAQSRVDLREKGQVLSKLKQFRSFYLLVIAYIYATRIIVYLFATLLDYKHLWVQAFIVEVITLSFYVVVGIMFRPMADNPYLSPGKKDDNDEEGIALTRTKK